MSVSSLRTNDAAYKGYEINTAGEVTEIYDHRDEDASDSFVGTSSYAASSHRPLVQQTHHNNHMNNRQRAKKPPKVKTVKPRKDAGCCDGCVRLLTFFGTLPCAIAVALLFSWIGTAFYVGGGWLALDTTLDLFRRYGPNDGNPATDQAPEFVFNNVGGSLGGSTFELRTMENLGNLVPIVFKGIKYSFYGIAPFMLIYTLIIACDNRRVKRTIAKNRPCGSSGICMTAGLVACSYFLVLSWVVLLCFVVLGLYYYRIVMLRCSDIADRNFAEGVFPSICVDLVQLGVIQFRNTGDPGFGKLCGPGQEENMRSFGRLQEYCNLDTGYLRAFRFMIIAFTGAFMNIIAMINFVMINSINYHSLTNRSLFRQKPAQTKTVIVTEETVVDDRHDIPLNPGRKSHHASRASLHSLAGPRRPHHHSVHSLDGLRHDVHRPTRQPSREAESLPPPYHYEARYRPNGSARRSDINVRSSKDIELDYMDSASNAPRRRDDDSNLGVRYYYK